MKRILTLLLVLALSVAAFTSCTVVDTVKGWFGGEETPTPNVPDEPEVDEGLQGAYDYVHQLYKEMKNTAGNYDLITSVDVEGVVYPITWSVDVESITFTDKTDENTGAALKTVNVPSLELGDPAISYKLTFVVTNTTTKETMTRTYDLIVPEFKISTPAQYYAAEKGTAIAVQGIVTGIMSKSAGDKENSLFVQDATNEGGYYIYALAADPAEAIQLGMTVLVKGDKDIYNGTHEIKNATVQIIDQTIKTVEPIDFTEIFTNAKNTSAEELIGKQGVLVTVKGVTIFTAGDNGYYNWLLAGKQSYLRISSSSNCTTADDEKTIIANFNNNFYSKADVTGIITIYNNAFYLQPVSADAFTNFEPQIAPDDVQVSMEKNGLTLPSEIVSLNNVVLPSTGASFKDVAITWALAETANASIVDGAIVPVIPETGSVEIKLTATLTLNNETATKEITITIKHVDKTSVVDANGICADQKDYTEEKYIVEGVIESIASDKYGNIYIKDAAGNKLYVYGLYSAYGDDRYDAMAKAGAVPKVGDTVVVYGILGQYKGDNQMKNAWLLSWNHNYVESTVGATCETEGYTSYTCACGDTRKENIVNALNHNYVDGVCTNNGCGKLDPEYHSHDFSVKGETVAPNCTEKGYTVYSCSGETCNETEKRDYVDALNHADTDGDFKCNNTGCAELVLPAADSTITIADALAIGKLTTTTQKYYISGVITKVYNTTYGNMYLTDGTNTITVYGTYDATGANRYDAMTNKPVAGDTITVYGILTSYNGVGQAKDAWITDQSTGHTCEFTVAATCTSGVKCKYCGTVQEGSEPIDHTFADATCQAPKTCTICKATEGDKAEHSYGDDGACTVCGHKEGAAEVVPTTVIAKHTKTATSNLTVGDAASNANDLGLDSTIFTVNVAKGGNNSAIGLNKDGTIRLYANKADGNGSELTISVAEGHTIKSIKITYGGVHGGCKVTVNGSAIATDTTANASETHDINASSFMLKNVSTPDNVQVYIKSIEITYV